MSPSVRYVVCLPDHRPRIVALPKTSFREEGKSCVTPPCSGLAIHASALRESQFTDAWGGRPTPKPSSILRTPWAERSVDCKHSVDPSRSEAGSTVRGRWLADQGQPTSGTRGARDQESRTKRHAVSSPQRSEDAWKDSRRRSGGLVQNRRRCLWSAHSGRPVRSGPLR